MPMMELLISLLEVVRIPQRSAMFPICCQNSRLPNAQPNF